MKKNITVYFYYSDTVDGSEIWRSPVEVGSFSNYLQGSQVVQDFFHKQYYQNVL